MLDKKYILENVELIKQNCINRGVNVDIDRFVELERQCKEIQIEIEELQYQANKISNNTSTNSLEGRLLRKKIKKLKATLGPTNGKISSRN